MRYNIWKDCPKVPITELLSFIVDNRGKTVPTADDGWQLIATNCVTNNTLFPVYEKVRYLTQETYETWFRAHPIPGDILFVNKGTPGRVCLVQHSVDFCIAQDMIALRADDEKIYNKYLFAVLRSREIQQQIYNTNVGDVIPHFKKQFMDQLLIPIPDRRIQEIIGNLYYELSYKTELNKKINKNLSDGKYADVQYTTASIDNLRTALVAAGAITEASSDTDVAIAFDKLLAASTVGADGLIKADHNIVISFADADADAKRGIASGNGWYANGDTVTLKVTPSVGYIFSKWTTDKAGNTSVGTESTYTFTLGADSPDEYYAWLDEVKYTVTCESVEGGAGKASEEQYVYGQIATVTAAANDNYEFVGWKDSYGTTVSTDAVYNFTVIGDATLTPEFVKVKTNEGADIAYVTVSFYHQSGKLLDSRKVVSGEGKITATVNAPTKVGFDFLGWSAKASGATAEDVVDFETATFSENTSLYPVFKAKDITYTLTVGSQTEQKAPQSSVTVTADPMEGKQFVGWKDADGNIVSYDSTYTFIITGDTTLSAYYEQADSEVVKEPTITIAQPTYEDITGGYKMAFYFNYTVPEDCKLVDIGIIRKKGDYKADGITLETDGVSQYSVLSKLGSEGQFYYTKSNYYGTGHTVTGYMIYEKNGIRYTVYSDSIYGVKNNKYSEN